MSNKIRIDLLMVEKGLETSREKAKRLIMEGNVYANGQKIDKAGEEVDLNSQLEIRGGTLAYVSRGGLKLEKAMKCFQIELSGKNCMDIGASTGGFTDCMLQNGAKKVYAVDVGYGQLAWKLRSDPRVISLERTNVRYLTSEQVPEPIDFFSVDISFISLELALPVVKKFLNANAQGVCLIKPQFEAGRENVGKKGVVRDPEVHKSVIRKIIDFASSLGFCVAGLDFSPVKGPEGNIEYLMLLRNTQGKIDPTVSIEQTVRNSHEKLDKNAKN